MGNRFFKGKYSSYKSSSSTPSKTGLQSPPPIPDERPRHQGSILGLSCIEDKLITCSDDNTLVVSSATASNGTTSQLVGHKRAVNRVVGFEHGLKSGKLMCWSASRDLSLRCVSFTFSSLSSLTSLSSYFSLYFSDSLRYFPYSLPPSLPPMSNIYHDNNNDGTVFRLSGICLLGHAPKLSRKLTP